MESRAPTNLLRVKKLLPECGVVTVAVALPGEDRQIGGGPGKGRIGTKRGGAQSTRHLFEHIGGALGRRKPDAKRYLAGVCLGDACQSQRPRLQPKNCPAAPPPSHAIPEINSLWKSESSSYFYLSFDKGEKLASLSRIAETEDNSLEEGLSETKSEDSSKEQPE